MQRDTQEIPRQRMTARQRVYAYIRDHRGATDEEIAAGTGIGLNTVRPRRKELEQYGEVYDTGQRATLDSGRLGIVWGVA